MREELRVRILTDAGEKFFGEGPYRLLRGVERLGSLRAAAGELGMAYSKANRIMCRAERLLGAPLTRRRIGGPDGGGSALTPLAQELLARYETFRADCEAAAKASFARNFGDLSMAAETANGFPPTSPNHPSGDSSFVVEARERRIDGAECAVAEQGSATAGDRSAQSSGDFIEAGRAAGDTCRSPEVNLDCSSGDLPFAAGAQAQRTSESENAVAARGVTAEEEYADKSALAAREMMAMEPSRFPGEASSATSGCSQTTSEDCERHADEPVLVAAMRPAAGESYCHSGEIPAALGCVVLAAGRARRFGGGKLLAELGGRPVLARTLEALPRESFCRIAVVTSDPAVSALCREMGFLVREYPGGALSDSIREGLAEIDGTDGCMFVNGDQPLLRPDSLRRLASAFADDPARVYRLAHGGIAASPVVFPTPAYPALRALTGESGGMAALRRGDWEVRCVEAEEEAELWDVDDPAALKHAEVRLREDLRR